MVDSTISQIRAALDNQNEKNIRHPGDSSASDTLARTGMQGLNRSKASDQGPAYKILLALPRFGALAIAPIVTDPVSYGAARYQPNHQHLHRYLVNVRFGSQSDPLNGFINQTDQRALNLPAGALP